MGSALCGLERRHPDILEGLRRTFCCPRQRVFPRLVVTLAAAALLAGLLCPVACFGAASGLNGHQYLALCSRLRAGGAVSSVSRGGSPSFDVSDLEGTLSGTIGSGEDTAAVLIDGDQSFIIAFGKSSLPPMGGRIRVLARRDSSDFRMRYTAVGWAFASDVTNAASKPQPAPAAAWARQHGTAVARGGSERERVDHTGFFQAYATAISRINPRLSQEQVNGITEVLLNTSRECDVDPRLVMAVVLAESHFNPSATSHKGAAGLGQLMPRTSRSMGVSNPYEPCQNLDASIRIIRGGLNKYSNNAAWKDLNWEHLRLALAAYNAGSGAVRKYGGVPPYRETRNYVAKVTSYYRQLCGLK